MAMPICALGVFVVVVAALPVDSKPAGDRKPAQPSNSTIIRACHDDVQQGLKAPSTAKFPSTLSAEAKVYVNKDKDVYTVESWVDAENAFGAMLRKDITCMFRWDGRNLERDKSLETDAALWDALQEYESR